MTDQETRQLENFVKDSCRAGIEDLCRIIVVICKILLRHRRTL
jgi:hypothetical protein